LIQKLFCIGLGYSAAAYIEAYGAGFDAIAGTVRTPAKQARLAETGIGGRRIEASVFDGRSPDGLTAAMRDATHLLVSAPPAETAETARMAFSAAGRPNGSLPVVYLSSLGVYGDYGCAEIDESAALKPAERGKDRVAAEQAWIDFGEATGNPVALLRLAGIYGPGRNALINVVSGQARRIVKPGQVFNRIHVADIARAIDAAFARKVTGAFNVSDDEPGPPQDVIAYAAELLGRTPPPEIPFDEAKQTMSPMALSFYDECKRALNTKLKTELGVTLLYPNYRVALDALFAARDHERAGSRS
jgi:nucleoside-diphosphate-sugar epimerase